MHLVTWPSVVIRDSIGVVLYLVTCLFPMLFVGGMAQWLGRRSLASGLSLIYG